MGSYIKHDALPVVKSPSGRALRHLVTAATGASALYAGEQWLAPGERVRQHTHPIEEVLIFIGGHGEARYGDTTVPVSAGVTLHIPAGEVHGFRNTGDDQLRVLVIFPGNTFAVTDFVEDPEPPR